ncbi:VOC family protein [Sporosarcina sp. Te-1]|uniref:VOC family protein n=1 Tax=Sporosarcina sp. Te-1 TaxID=2818390 RepID=UPI001A9E0F91|nr:glyoxalase/bleomycin resistance/extradiol dioxygenase family protein [Sporosarcina sp. Te-1]QTD41255.1 glyoxalase/bleomycin resistance/extradiol dioxygenase family protein [Sporosarcina sp. Te-1]
MAVDIYLTFNGNCREAIEFYSEVFKTEQPQVMTFGEAPPNPEYPLPEDAKDLIMHGRLKINGSTVMFSDTFPGSKVMEGTNISLAIVSNDRDAIQESFEKLKQGGTVKMELQETFFSKCYGSVRDRFGIEWQLSYEEQ